MTFDEKDSILDVARGLKETAAKGLIFSPSTLNQGNEKRANEIYKLVPEIAAFHAGDEFSCKNFPSLKTLMHTGHKTIRGASKFKENMSYVKKENTLLRIPGTSPEAVAIECYKGGEKFKQYSNSEIVKLADSFAKAHLSSKDLTPIFLTLTLSYPLGLVTLLGCAQAGRKAYLPASYNLSDIVAGFETQHSKTLVCD